MRLAFALALAATASSATAGGPKVTLREPRAGMELDLDIPDASICVIRPKELRDPEACEGLNVDEIAESVRNNPANAFAFVQFEDWECIVVEQWEPSPEAVFTFTREEGRELHRLVPEVMAGVGRYRPEKAEPDFLVVNDRLVLKYAMVTPDPVPAPAMVFSHVAVKQGRRGGRMTLTFGGDLEHLARLKEIAALAVRSVRGPPDHEPAIWFETRKEALSHRARVNFPRALARVLVGLAILGGLIAALVRALLQRGR